ncbi:protein kinase [Streptomyces nigra]
MGRVWRAVDEMLDRLVAVKEMRIDGLDPEDTRTRRERTLREARATARIDHPHVVRVYDVVDEGEHLWIVMELVAGRSLERIMAEDGPLGPAETARIGLGLVAALRQVHARGVLHRDIKPGNVLVETEAARGRGRVVLTDFGIAAIQDAKALTMVGMLVGSPDYMAPERISGRRQGPPSDVWSLGATLCAALAGRSPFSRDTTLATLHAVLYEEPELPSTAGPLHPILTALLQKDPSARPTLDTLESSLHPVASPPPTPTLPVPHPLLPPQPPPLAPTEGFTPTPPPTPEQTPGGDTRPAVRDLGQGQGPAAAALPPPEGPAPTQHPAPEQTGGLDAGTSAGEGAAPGQGLTAAAQPSPEGSAPRPRPAPEQTAGPGAGTAAGEGAGPGHSPVGAAPPEVYLPTRRTLPLRRRPGSESPRPSLARLPRGLCRARPAQGGSRAIQPPGPRRPLPARKPHPAWSHRHRPPRAPPGPPTPACRTTCTTPSRPGGRLHPGRTTRPPPRSSGHPPPRQTTGPAPPPRLPKQPQHPHPPPPTPQPAPPPSTAPRRPHSTNPRPAGPRAPPRHPPASPSSAPGAPFR